MSYILAARIRREKRQNAIAAAEKAGMSSVKSAEKLVAKKFAAFKADPTEKNRILLLWARKVYLGCQILEQEMDDDKSRHRAY